MHGLFGYNVTIMYSTMYSELELFREFADKMGIGLNSKTGGDEHGNSRRSKRKL